MEREIPSFVRLCCEKPGLSKYYPITGYEYTLFRCLKCSAVWTPKVFDKEVTVYLNDSRKLAPDETVAIYKGGVALYSDWKKQHQASA